MIAGFFFIIAGFLSWDKDSCHVDLEKELLALVAQAPEGEEARNGIISHIDLICFEFIIYNIIIIIYKIIIIIVIIIIIMSCY